MNPGDNEVAFGFQNVYFANTISDDAWLNYIPFNLNGD